MLKVQDFLRFGDFLLSSFVEQQQGGVASVATNSNLKPELQQQGQGGLTPTLTLSPTSISVERKTAAAKWLQNTASLPAQCPPCVVTSSLCSNLSQKKIEKDLETLKINFNQIQEENVRLRDLVNNYETKNKQYELEKEKQKENEKKELEECKEDKKSLETGARTQVEEIKQQKLKETRKQEELAKKCEALEKELETAQKQIEKSNEAKKEVENKIVEIEKKASILEKNLQSTQKEVETSNEARTKVENEIKKIKTEASKQVEVIKEQKEKEKGEQEELKKSLQNIKKQVQESETAKKKVEDEIAEFKIKANTEKKELKDKIEDIENREKKAREELQNIKKELEKQKEKTIANENNTQEALKKGNDQKGQDDEKYQMLKLDLEEKVRKAQTENEKITENCQKLQEEFKKKEKTFKEEQELHVKELAETKNSFQIEQELKAEIQKELDKCTKTLKMLEEKEKVIAELKTQNDVIPRQLEEETKTKEEVLTLQIQAAEKTKKELQEKTIEIEKCKIVVEQEEKEKKELKEEKDRIKENEEACKKSNVTLTENHKSCTISLTEEKKTTTSLNEKVISLEKQLQDVQAKNITVETVSDIAILDDFSDDLPQFRRLLNLIPNPEVYRHKPPKHNLSLVLVSLAYLTTSFVELLDKSPTDTEKLKFYNDLQKEMQNLVNQTRENYFNNPNIHFLQALSTKVSQISETKKTEDLLIVTQVWNQIEKAYKLFTGGIGHPGDETEYQFKIQNKEITDYKTVEKQINEKKTLLRHTLFASAFLGRAANTLANYFACVLDLKALRTAKENWSLMKKNLESKIYKNEKEPEIKNYFALANERSSKSAQWQINNVNEVVTGFDLNNAEMNIKCEIKKTESALPIIRDMDLDLEKNLPPEKLSQIPELLHSPAFDLWFFRAALVEQFQSWIKFIEEVSKVRIFVILNEKKKSLDKCNKSFFRNFKLEIQSNGQVKKQPKNFSSDCSSVEFNKDILPPNILEDKNIPYLLVHPIIQKKQKAESIPTRAYYGPFFEVFEDFNNKEIYCGGKLDLVSSSGSGPSETLAESTSLPLTCLNSKYLSVDGRLPQNLTADTNGLTRMIQLILEGKQVIMCPYGYSGVGKTYITQGSANNNTPGIIQYTIEGLLKLPSVTKIELTRVDFIYGRAEKAKTQEVNLQSCVFQKKVYSDSTSVPRQEWYNFENSDMVKCSTWIQDFAKKMYIQEDESVPQKDKDKDEVLAKKRKKFFSLPILTSKTKNLNGLLFEFFTHVEEFQMEVDLIKPTANNPKSSRAHTFFPFDIYLDQNGTKSVGSLYFGDLAGIENPNELRKQLTSRQGTKISAFATRGWKLLSNEGPSTIDKKGTEIKGKTSIDRVAGSLAQSLISMNPRDQATYFKKFGIKGEVAIKNIETQLRALFNPENKTTNQFWSNYFGDQILEGVAITESNKQLRYLLGRMQNSGEMAEVDNSSGPFLVKIDKYDSESRTFLLNPEEQVSWKVIPTVAPTEEKISLAISAQSCAQPKNNLSFFPYLVSAMKSYSKQKAEIEKDLVTKPVTSLQLGEDTIFALLAVVAPDLNLNTEKLTKGESAAVNTVRFAQSLTFGLQEVPKKVSKENPSPDSRSSSPTRPLNASPGRGKTTGLPNTSPGRGKTTGSPHPNTGTGKSGRNKGKKRKEDDLSIKKTNQDSFGSKKVNKLALQWQKQVSTTFF